MGKYLPILMTARCGSLNKAAGLLGYTQPSLWYIINTMESDLGVKLFHRTKRGVTLTEAGKELLTVMEAIEESEEQLHKIAQSFLENRIQVGVCPGLPASWLPELLPLLNRDHPEVKVKLETFARYADGARAVSEHTLDCCFSVLREVPGLEALPLFDDPYYLVLSQEHPLAHRDRAAPEDILDGIPLIPSAESCDPDSPLWDLYRKTERVLMADSTPPEPQVALAMAERGLGAAILPGLVLESLTVPDRVTVLPMANGLYRTVSLLTRKTARPAPLLSFFTDLVARFAESRRAGRSDGD